MIVIFHYIINCLYTYLNRINCVRSVLPNFTITQHLNDPFAIRTPLNDIRFDPPLYKQRYQRVCQLLLDERWRNQIKTIVDFGCAELDLFVHLKNSFNYNRIVLVDIDEDTLTESLHRIRPLIADHINRSHQLSVEVYVGSVAESDDCLRNIDAVIAIELIEHLYPYDLEALPYNIFANIRPKLAIFTTPNIEFNQLFLDKKRFRHADHKFEWTREQFRTWSLNIVERFPDYLVAFDGVGLGPRGTESLGTCTQIAVFVRKDIICDTISMSQSYYLPKSYGICSYYSLSKRFETYKLITQVDYPYTIDKRSEEERILDEIKYKINLYSQINSIYFNYATNRLEIPLEKFIYNNHGQFITVPELRGLLLKSDYTIEECRLQDSNNREICLIINPNMDNSDQTNSDASGYESDNKFNTDGGGNYSDWDDQRNDHNNKLYDSGYQKSPLNDESPSYTALLQSNCIDNINEFDRLPIMKQICEEIAKHPIAGPSNLHKLSKESSIDDDDDDDDEDDDDYSAKLLTNCIIENSLNRIEIPEDRVELIEQQIERQLEPMIVENGDLANNNRDLEGNNYPAVEDQHDPQEMMDNQQHNRINIDNNNEINGVVEDLHDVVENDEEAAIDDEVVWPSREALLDSNSHIDLLDDFEMDAVQNDLVINSINPIDNDEGDAFPYWFLVLFNEDTVETETAEDDAHFYCQGDGLGVHQSTDSILDDDNDTEDFDETTTTTTTNTTTTTSSVSGFLEVNPENRDVAEQSSEQEEFFEAVEDQQANLIN